MVHESPFLKLSPTPLWVNQPDYRKLHLQIIDSGWVSIYG